MKQTIVVGTVGESTTERVLDSIKNYAPTAKILVWCDTRGKFSFSDPFVTMLNKYTDDVICLSKNHGVATAISFTSLYVPSDIVCFNGADALFYPDTWPRILEAFEKYPRAVVVGGTRKNNFPEQMWVSDLQHFPDEVFCLNRNLVNEVGGICASFTGYGHEPLEYCYRVIDHGYDVVTLQDLFLELNGGHEGRSGNPNLEKDIDHSARVIHATNHLRANGGYNWFDNKVRERVS